MTLSTGHCGDNRRDLTRARIETINSIDHSRLSLARWVSRRMAQDEVPAGLCPCCRAPITELLQAELCMLNDSCCPACMARCAAAGRCGLITDAEFWKNLDALLERVAKHRVVPGDTKY